MYLVSTIGYIVDCVARSEVNNIILSDSFRHDDAERRLKRSYKQTTLTSLDCHANPQPQHRVLSLNHGLQILFYFSPLKYSFSLLL
jgi:hypothetical protein